MERHMKKSIENLIQALQKTLTKDHNCCCCCCSCPDWHNWSLDMLRGRWLSRGGKIYLVGMNMPGEIYLLNLKFPI